MMDAVNELAGVIPTFQGAGDHEDLGEFNETTSRSTIGSGRASTASRRQGSPWTWSSSRGWRSWDSRLVPSDGGGGSAFSEWRSAFSSAMITVVER
jgi:hypothetical protein